MGGGNDRGSDWNVNKLNNFLKISSLNIKHIKRMSSNDMYITFAIVVGTVPSSNTNSFILQKHLCTKKEKGSLYS